MKKQSRPGIQSDNSRFTEYYEAFARIPEPLQKQILIRLGLALGSLLMILIILILIADRFLLIPFIGIFVFNIIWSWNFYDIAVNNKYVVISGRCIDANLTIIKRYTKSVTIETEEHVIQINTKQRWKKILLNTELDIYVADKTLVYSKDGIEVLHSYLAININGGKRVEKGK